MYILFNINHYNRFGICLKRIIRMTLFRRSVDIVSTQDQDEGEVRAALEDDFHHFRVRAYHRANLIVEIEGQALRYPYSACPEATGQLQHLIGMPLSSIAHSVTRQTDAQHQCTHLLDLAGLAIATAARRTPRCRYDIRVPRRINGKTSPVLELDGEALLNWDVNGSIIENPEPFVGIDLRAGMARWALNNLPEELAQAALLLRRSTQISIGRVYNLDLQEHASSTGRCYSQQPVRAPSALRIKGSTWDFGDTPDALCKTDQEWLQQAARFL
jgi:hypothetical protein